MSAAFFRDLGIPEPDVHLGVGSGSQGQQTARLIERYEEWLVRTEKPGATLVVGDVNSTMACALVSSKLHVPVVHVEAGLRSRDRTMPEEINRLVTDSISDLLFASEPSAVSNLLGEGHAAESVHLAGNVMVDTLRSWYQRAMAVDQAARLGLTAGHYGVCTLHRPGNVDDNDTLVRLLHSLESVADRLPIVFAVHPRTRGRLREVAFDARRIRLIDPLGYLEFLSLTALARLVITDSGGLQEETTALGVPCLTLRSNTERPITVSEGTSTLVGSDTALLEQLVDDVLAGRYKRGRCPELWDGHASDRIAGRLAEFLLG